MCDQSREVLLDHPSLTYFHFSCLMKLRINPATMEPVNVVEEGENKALVNVNKHAVRPIMLLLKIFALNPCGTQRQQRRTNVKSLFSAIYSILVILAMIANLIRIFPALLRTKDYTFYIRLCVLVWYTRCLLMAVYVTILNWRSKGKTSKLGSLIKDLDANLNVSSIKNDIKAVKSYKKRCKMFFVSTCVVIATTCISIPLAIFVKELGAHKVLNSILYPFQEYSSLKIVYCVLDVYLSIAWMAPILLYNIACNSIVLQLSIVQSKVGLISENLSVGRYVDQIRPMYLQLTGLVEKADEMFGLMALCVYLFDIVLFSLNLYVSLYIAKSVLEHCVIWFWIMMALFNLLIMSFDASRVVEKVCKPWTSYLGLFFRSVPPTTLPNTHSTSAEDS